MSISFLKKRLWHRCFPADFAKFLRTPLVAASVIRLFDFHDKVASKAASHIHIVISTSCPSKTEMGFTDALW